MGQNCTVDCLFERSTGTCLLRATHLITTDSMCVAVLCLFLLPCHFDRTKATEKFQKNEYSFNFITIFATGINF